MHRYDDLVATLNLSATPVEAEPLPFGKAMDKLEHNAYTFTATLIVLPSLH